MTVQGARDKGTSGKFYDFDGNTRRIGTLDITKTAADADFHSLKIRRERAYQWHSRWAMPNYDQMKTNVIKAGPGLDSEYGSRYVDGDDDEDDDEDDERNVSGCLLFQKQTHSHLFLCT